MGCDSYWPSYSHGAKPFMKSPILVHCPLLSHPQHLADINNTCGVGPSSTHNIVSYFYVKSIRARSYCSNIAAKGISVFSQKNCDMKTTQFTKSVANIRLALLHLNTLNLALMVHCILLCMLYLLLSLCELLIPSFSSLFSYRSETKYRKMQSKPSRIDSLSYLTAVE